MIYPVLNLNNYLLYIFVIEAVKEVGIGGNDGGVDFVIIDKRGEKTAVQAKCCAEGNLIYVSIRFNSGIVN